MDYIYFAVILAIITLLKKLVKMFYLKLVYIKRWKIAQKKTPHMERHIN